jgi:murein DD-endopeptidase MepM/ murein hydrolase activator NlpD
MAQFSHIHLIVSSLAILSACTQPAVVVENRGTDHFGKNRNYSVASTSIAAPVASVASSDTPRYVGSQPIYSASREQDQQAAIGVSDLAPAAGKAEIKTSALSTAAPFGKPTAASVSAIQTKPVTLSSDEPAPINPWTKKPRETANLTGEVLDRSATYIWPVSSHNVTSTFGKKGGGKANDGISIAASEGEPVWAAADGEVVYADAKMKGYGNMVIVKHVGGKTTTYAHLARMGVDKYDRVKQGDIIGYVGSTGNVKDSQLYFSMREGTQAVDPQKYLDRKVAGL